MTHARMGERVVQGSESLPSAIDWLVAAAWHAMLREDSTRTEMALNALRKFRDAITGCGVKASQAMPRYIEQRAA